MKVAILNTSELTGGAAVAANRLMRALRKADIEACMLVRDRRSDDSKVVSVNSSFISRKINFVRFVWERLVIFACNWFSKRNLFQVSIANTGANIARHPIIKEADIIHIHWINQGFLSLNDIERLVETGKPIVWTLHDLWPATAICHYPAECDRYVKGCYDCPMLRKNPIFDLASYIFKEKGRIGLSRINFVGCSDWIMREAKKGAWLKEAMFASIPNPIDTSIFNPMEKRLARKRFGLPEDKYLLLFAAAKLSDTRKGALFLVEACKQLKKKYRDGIEILLMGGSSEELVNRLPFKVNALGYISDQASMVAAYSSANMFIIPSLEDNLPNTIMESMACGTPCVGFDTGGIPEMIDHQQNGYIAKYKDTKDLASGIEWILEHEVSRKLGKACVTKVQTTYQEPIIAGKYIKLYTRLLNK